MNNGTSWIGSLSIYYSPAKSEMSIENQLLKNWSSSQKGKEANLEVEQVAALAMLAETRRDHALHCVKMLGHLLNVASRVLAENSTFNYRSNETMF